MDVRQTGGAEKAPRLFIEAVNMILRGMMADVEQFQNKIIGLQCAVSGPALLPANRQEFRTNFLGEEIDEINTAYRCADPAGVIDGIVDMMYVGLGMLLEMGVDPAEAFAPVQTANMAKRRGETLRGEQYDAIKPDGWQPPDHEAILQVLALRSRMSPAFLEATRIREERGAQYNHGSVKRADHFPFGNYSHAQMMWIKAIRLRAAIEAGEDDPAVLSEHLRDQINYLAFWWESLNGGIL